MLVGTKAIEISNQFPKEIHILASSTLTLKNIIFSITFTLSFLACTGIFAQPSNPGDYKGRLSISERFDGEVLKYNIGFWWFNNVAVGELSLKKMEGDYLISLQAETKGMIGWISRYRKDKYLAHVEEVDGGRRFRFKSFEKEVNIGGKVRRSVTVLDYENGTVKWRIWGSGEEEEAGEKLIPDDTFYDDPLSAFYNFRYGVYGHIEAGREFYVPAFPKDGSSPMYMRLVTEEERLNRTNKPDSVAFIADIRINKDMFGSSTGDIEVSFTRELLPINFVIKDLIFFGDIWSDLVEVETKAGITTVNDLLIR